MIKIPALRAKAVEASFPTFVDAGRVFFKMRRTQARGGSNSTAVGKACCCVCVCVGDEAVAGAAGEVGVSPVLLMAVDAGVIFTVFKRVSGENQHSFRRK